MPWTLNTRIDTLKNMKDLESSPSTNPSRVTIIREPGSRDWLITFPVKKYADFANYARENRLNYRKLNMDENAVTIRVPSGYTMHDIQETIGHCFET